MPFSNKFRLNQQSDSSDYMKPYQAWTKDPTPANASEMLKSIDPLIDKAISAHVGQVDTGTRSRARRIALKSLRTWDPNRAALPTYLTHQMAALKRYQAQRSPGISIPERVSLDKKMLDETEEELRGDLGREPSIQELADRAKISTKRISYLRNYANPVAEGQLLATTGGTFSPAVLQETEAWPEVVYTDLDPTNQLIFDWTLGMHGKQPLSNLEIARKLRLSPAAVSKRKAHIQMLLDQQEELSPFSGEF